MKPISLELLHHISGIGSASGIFFDGSAIFIASDNARVLYKFDSQTNAMSKIKLSADDVLENIPKPQKPDFEALTEKDGKLYLFGSGSTDRRNSLYIVDRATNAVEICDLSELYLQMRNISGIDAQNFNIEGAFATADAWFLFQRGNGAGGNNGIFKLSAGLDASVPIEFIAMQLPKIKHVATSFTDAVLAQDEIWFLATAEDTSSTYDDGEILGSVVGKIDFRTMEIAYSEQISDAHKFEGLAFYAASDSEISFLLCEDNDTDATESSIYKLTVVRQ